MWLLPKSSAFRDAGALIEKATKAQKPLDQRLLIAAAITTVLQSPPIVVGGTAEEYWTRDEYRPTDLDLIPRPSVEEKKALAKLGFRMKNRHWIRDDLPVGTEFPHDESFEIRRTHDENVGGAVVRLIGVDDLYLDRLSQSTAKENVLDQSFKSVLAVAVANWDLLDWPYIEKRIAEISKEKPGLGESMQRMHRQCLRIGRRKLAERRARQL